MPPSARRRRRARRDAPPFAPRSRYCDAPARRENESDGGDSPRAASEDPIVATSPETKRRRAKEKQATAVEETAKGLRHFSEKVCKKVEEKGSTTRGARARASAARPPRAGRRAPAPPRYNEVADELVSEYLEEQARLTGQRPDDEKNIRRRVYDALNVLMAMDIISKEKKEIKWCGLPSYADSDLDVASRDVDRARKSVARKRRHVEDLLRQQSALANLRRRNAARGGGPAAGSPASGEAAPHLALPFIAVATRKTTTVRCEMTDDRREVFFDFSGPYEIIDDADVLKRLKLHEPQPDEPPPPDERARTDSEVKMPPPLPVIEPPKPAESA